MGSLPSVMLTNHESEHIGKLYFDPKADQPGIGYFITDAELRERLGELVDETEKILEVRYYNAYKSNPLFGVGISGIFPQRHAFIVFETENWWWSIEKNENGVTIQRSKKLEYVRDYYRGQDRTTELFQLGPHFEGRMPECEKKKYQGSTTVKELITHIYVKDYLNGDYYVGLNQDFAEKIYQFI